VLRVSFTAGFDGSLPESPEDPDVTIRAALAEIIHMPAAMHERDVHEELELILCPACRMAVRQQLQAIGRYKGEME
jgi:hypothetical protein